MEKKQKLKEIDGDATKFEQVDRKTLNKPLPPFDYKVEIDQEKAKREMNMVIIGHVDAGKSTLMGHLLHKMGKIDNHSVTKQEKLSESYGKSSFHFAFFMDEDEEERRRGITINTAQAHILTPHKNFTVIDAPGHKDFISNMISGASQAECAILVIDGNTNAFEKGFEGGSTKDHAILARSLGVTQICVAVNKLDMVQWNEARFDEIC
mmetsp:Transcript_26242/g.40052  ORF Transcript_26242/g.40052 Transcript_26242/m.40052 type:complete len:208 (+) Transcript_26242:583-1206(+)